ncbi:uncharacterized protein LOC144860842 [Branchiostoma floridae x Branchiostoma japonicum]
MADENMASLTSKLQNLELCLKSQHGQELGYGQALREAILSKDLFMEVEVLKSLGDLQLQKGKLSKDSAEFDKAAALYAAAVLRCTDPGMGQTLEYRIGYLEKLSRQLLQGYTPHFRSPDYWDTADSNVLRVAEFCDKLDRNNKKLQHLVEETYTKALVTAIGNSDMFLEFEVLKSQGDLYLEKGKKTCDVSQFSKAAAMYNKALSRCGDPETKLTLEHRIKYMEKIRDEKPPSKKRQPRERPPMDHQSGNTTGTDIIQDQHLHPDRSRLYTDHLKEGDSSLARADLDSAEQHFAAALRAVHARDPTAKQYQREVKPLCKLGDVYSKRGQQTGDGGNFVKAAALYNVAIARSEDQVIKGDMIVLAIKKVEKLFFKYIFGLHCNVSKDNTEKHKKQLKEMRDQIKLEMETIDQQLDPYVHKEDNTYVKEIEAKRAQAVRQLFEKIAQQRKEFISLLVEECIALIAPPPCKYALIGLGSQATGLVTPYSDLEFAILVEEESEECLVYFRNLTHYLHLKVVNLGETILPALGIKSLNDFYSKDPLDNWYYDSVTPRGFAFDGSMPKASKTPLGRQGTMDKPPSELICTPENMVSILQKDVTLYLKEGYHLATILRNPCLIAGDQDFIDTYMALTVEILKADGGKMALHLARETLKDNMERINNKETITARLTDVKKDLYRFPAVAVDCLALSSGIVPTTVWETIEEMENHQSTAYPDIANSLNNLGSAWSDFGDYKKATRYYEQALQMCQIIYGQRTAHPDIAMSLNNLGLAWDKLDDYKKAISYHEQALQMNRSIYGQTTAHPHIATSLNNLGSVWNNMGDYKKAISYFEQALQMQRSYGQTTAHPDIASSLNNLGGAWDNLGDYRKAISYYEQAMQMRRRIHGQTTAHPDIATSLNNLGGQTTAHPHIATSLSNLGLVWNSMGDYKKAISYYKQALQMRRSIYGQTTAHPYIVKSLNNLGGAWDNQGDYIKAISYYEQALQMERSFYGQDKAHPDIANSLNNLGLAWNKLGDYRKAISYYEQAMQVERRIYGQDKAHPDIVKSLNNLGMAWDNQGDYIKAISYSEQALQMNRSIYGQGTAHPHTAKLLNNLGMAWDNQGDYRKAISYYEQALQMERGIYGQDKAHPDIANSLNNLGLAWNKLGDYRKAISYYEQAMQMERRIYGQDKAHPDIVKSLNNLGMAWDNQAHPHTAKLLNNLGMAWDNQGDYRKAISYYEQALQMERGIYGQDKAHPDIANSLNNLGLAWNKLGDYRKAISYHEQALQMFMSIYGQTTAHPGFYASLTNLGMTWDNLGDYIKAISYHEQALQMCRSIYGQNTAHPHTANSLNNLGLVWDNLDDYRKAISYYEQAMQMLRIIYGQSTVHPDIANSLHNLGSAWNKLDDYRKAISHLEQALQMRRSIYQSRAHPDIAASLNNLGMAWHHNGDHRKAISLCQEAFDMLRQVYPQDKSPPLLKTTESNLASIGLKTKSTIDHQR